MKSMKGSVDNMEMFINTRSDVLRDENGEPVTPYHLKYATNDFTQILDPILEGEIPTATGQPFSVEKNLLLEQDPSDYFGGSNNIFVKR